MHSSPRKYFSQQIRNLKTKLGESVAFCLAISGVRRRGDGGRKERDGIFVTEECVHIVECTASHKKDKAEEDVKKIFHLSKTLRLLYPYKVIKGWMVTLDEPTADQRTVVDRHKDLVVTLSYDEFRAKIVDARAYLNLRRQYPFGSVRDPDGSPIKDLNFVPLDMVDKSTGDVWPLPRILDSTSTGLRIVLLGDYGAGKSSTMREIFIELAKRFWNQETAQFPLLLNLRDHHGQSNPVEALERHGRNIAYPNPSHLVRAWRSGFLILLLDGFDEIATSGWLNQSTKLKDLRFKAMQLIRAFVDETPVGGSVMLAGRSHFFGGARRCSIRSRYNNPRMLHLDEFTDDQVEQFLKSQAGTAKFRRGYLLDLSCLATWFAENSSARHSPRMPRVRRKAGTCFSIGFAHESPA